MHSSAIHVKSELPVHTNSIRLLPLPHLQPTISFSNLSAHFKLAKKWLMVSTMRQSMHLGVSSNDSASAFSKTQTPFPQTFQVHVEI